MVKFGLNLRLGINSGDLAEISGFKIQYQMSINERVIDNVSMIIILR